MEFQNRQYSLDERRDLSKAIGFNSARRFFEGAFLRCGGGGVCRKSDPPQAESPATQDFVSCVRDYPVGQDGEFPFI